MYSSCSAYLLTFFFFYFFESFYCLSASFMELLHSFSILSFSASYHDLVSLFHYQTLFIDVTFFYVVTPLVFLHAFLKCWILFFWYPCITFSLLPRDSLALKFLWSRYFISMLPVNNEEHLIKRLLDNATVKGFRFFFHLFIPLFHVPSTSPRRPHDHFLIGECSTGGMRSVCKIHSIRGVLPVTFSR